MDPQNGGRPEEEPEGQGVLRGVGSGLGGRRHRRGRGRRGERLLRPGAPQPQEKRAGAQVHERLVPQPEAPQVQPHGDLGPADFRQHRSVGHAQEGEKGGEGGGAEGAGRQGQVGLQTHVRGGVPEGEGRDGGEGEADATEAVPVREQRQDESEEPVLLRGLVRGRGGDGALEGEVSERPGRPQEQAVVRGEEGPVPQSGEGEPQDGGRHLP